MIIIGGPTASGKTALGVALAKKIGNCLLVNGDSLQLYRDLQVITARPTEDEFEGIDHSLFGVLGLNEITDVAWWQQQVKDILAYEKRTLIVIGGSGLYLRALTYGLSPIPQISPEIRSQVRQKAKETTRLEFQEWAYDIDPMLRGKLTDPQRLSRAIEVKMATGESLIAQQGRAQPLVDNYRMITLLPPRELLYERINTRLVHMFDQGAIDEVMLLDSVSLPLKSPLRQAIGVREIQSYLRGDISKDQALTLAQQSTRQYAKRQMTWFRHQAPQGILIHNLSWNLNELVKNLMSQNRPVSPPIDGNE